MTMRVRTGLMLILALATLGLASCGHYVCGANFGSSTCSSGALSLSGSGTGNTAAAFAFVVDGSGNGQVVGYTLNTNFNPPTLTGTPNFIAPATPHADAGLGMAVAQKQFVYAAFGSTQQIFGWTIASTGSLTAVSGSPVSVPQMVTGATFEFDTARVITNPAGTLLFVGDEFASQVFVYQIGTGGTLTAVAGSPFPVAFPAGNMTTDGLGKYLYFTNSDSGSHSGSEIAVYSIGSTGSLTAVGSPFVANMWQVLGEPTGQFLIGTSGQPSDAHLYVFTIGSAGALTGPVLYPTTYDPFSIAVQQNSGGNIVYSFANATTGTANTFDPVEGFKLSAGVLSQLGGSPFTNANVGNYGQFDQSGGLLFVYGGVNDVTSVVYQLTSFDVSGGNLITPTPTGTYGGYWVVTDAP